MKKIIVTLIVAYEMAKCSIRTVARNCPANRRDISIALRRTAETSNITSICFTHKLILTR